MKIYTVCRTEFDNSGDYSYPVGGSNPVKAFRSHEKAVDECARLNREVRVDRNPQDYTDEDPWRDADIDDLREATGLNEDELSDSSDIGDSWESWSSPVKHRLWSLSDIDHNMWFSVSEIEVEDCRVREPANAR